MKNKPLVSVVTASYNSEKTIVKTLNSILIQNGVNELFKLEHIIIDGASRDSTMSIIEDFREKYNTKGVELIVKSENDSGIYDAWNKGLKLSSGDWISFLGSDDYYLDNALKHYFHQANNSTYNYLSSKVAIINKDTSIKEIIGESFDIHKFKRYMNVAHVGSFHHKSLYEKYGTYNTNYKIAGDYEFLLRALPDLKCGFINSISAHMLGNGVSQNNLKKVFLETYQAKVKNGVRSPIFARVDYFIGWLKIILKKTILEIFN